MGFYYIDTGRQRESGWVNCAERFHEEQTKMLFNVVPLPLSMQFFFRCVATVSSSFWIFNEFYCAHSFLMAYICECVAREMEAQRATVHR